MHMCILYMHTCICVLILASVRDTMYSTYIVVRPYNKCMFLIAKQLAILPPFYRLHHL